MNKPITYLLKLVNNYTLFIYMIKQSNVQLNENILLLIPLRYDKSLLWHGC